MPPSFSVSKVADHLPSRAGSASSRECWLCLRRKYLLGTHHFEQSAILNRFTLSPEITQYPLDIPSKSWRISSEFSVVVASTKCRCRLRHCNLHQKFQSFVETFIHQDDHRGAHTTCLAIISTGSHGSPRHRLSRTVV